MGCLRGCRDGGPKLALSCVLVIFWLLFMATTVTAPLVANASRSVFSAVQEPLLTDEPVALREIASALNRNVELVTNNFSWIKVALLQLGVLFVIEILKIFTGVPTQYLVDLWRERMHQDPLAAYATEVADLRAQLAEALNLIKTITADASRKEEETNKKVDWLEERLKFLDPRRRDNSRFWPRVETEPVLSGKESSH